MTFKTAFKAGFGLYGFKRAALTGAAGAILLASPALSQQADTPHADEYWGMLETYCTECHNFTDWAGGIAFDTMTPETLPDDAETWEATVRKLRGRLMPPPGNPQPDQAQINEFVGWMEANLDSVAPTPNAGHVPIHRLNRNEYAAVVKDLIGVDIDSDTVLPTEMEIEGFSNVASALGVSPAFLDQYVTAARRAARLATGDPAGKTASTFYPAPSYNQSDHVEGLPLGTRGGMSVTHNFPADGEYRINVLDVGAGLYLRAMERETTLLVLVDNREVFRTKLGGPEDLAMLDKGGAEGRAKILERVSDIKAQVTAGPHDVTVTFIERARALSDDWNRSGRRFRFGRMARIGDGIEIWGPYNATGISATASREKIFVCQPDRPEEERACAEEIATDLARRAFRRPVTDKDIASLMPFYEAGRATGGSFDSGIQQIVTAVLVSPDFLYRAITPPADESDHEAYALSDLELASRLSFFLWSQGPDDALIELAAEGDLTKPEVMERQVRRMLADPRAEALVRNFALQWLNLDELDAVEPDPALFPGFTDEMRAAFSRELEMYLDSILLADKSILDLLTAEHTFVNQQLARHYGIDDVFGGQFRRVTLDDPNRFGLLGKGAFLLRTSYGDRTSPVLRGAWVLEKLVGTPPAPPPPNVEAFPENKPGEKVLTVRARLEQHRADPSCNSCHGVIDPYGLALENFTVTGQWRERDAAAGQVIDPRAELTSGAMVSGPVELREHLLKRPEQFVQALTERLMMYALGRELEYHDMPEVREIVRAAAEEDYRLSAIVLGIVNSDAFRMQAPPEDDAIQEAALSSDQTVH